MKKSILFLSLVAMVAFTSCCGNKSKECKEEPNAEVAKVCAEKEAMMAQWAKFDSLAVEEQEALLAKRAELFGQLKAKCAEKATEKKGHCSDMEGKTDEQKAACNAKKMVIAEIDSLWNGFATMTIAEKKAFFDKVDSLKPNKKEVKSGCVDKEKKGCCKDNKEKKSCDKPCDKPCDKK